MSEQWKTRLSNPYFYLALVGAVLATVGVDAQSLTSWGLLIDQIKSVCLNPFALVSCIFAVIGIINNPTTPGLKDISTKQTTVTTRPVVSEEKVDIPEDDNDDDSDVDDEED